MKTTITTLLAALATFPTMAADQPLSAKQLLQKISPYLESRSVAAPPQLQINDGTPIDSNNAQLLHKKLSRQDKLRLSLPMEPQQDLSSLFGQRHFDLIVKHSDPEISTISTWDSNGNPIPHPVKLLTYNGRLSGDVLVMRAGDTLFIELENELVKAPLKDGNGAKIPGTGEPTLRWKQDVPLGSDGKPVNIWLRDAPQAYDDPLKPEDHESLYSSNLHFHGGHVSPGGSQDNVFLVNPPKPSQAGSPKELFLNYVLDTRHVAGTFWYHPHLHGGVAYQVANGMAGALIVEPAKGSNIWNLDEIPEVEKANVEIDTNKGSRKLGRVFLLQQLALKETINIKTKNGQPVWMVDPGDVNDRRELDPTQTHNPDFGNNETVDVTLVNGGEAPAYTMQPGQVERWRFIHAGKEASIPLVWLKTDFTRTGADDLEMVRIAEDGIPCEDTDEAGRFVNHATAPAEKPFEMQPGYRSDMLVKPLKAGKYYLMSEKAPKFVGDKPYPAQLLATLEVKGDFIAMDMPPVEKVRRCVPSDIHLLSAKIDQRVAFNFVDKKQFGVNGAPWAATKKDGALAPLGPIKQTLNHPERWELSVEVPATGVGVSNPDSATEAEIMDSRPKVHPFHIHVNPFQVENFPRKGLNMWKDTFAISATEGPRTIRILPKDYPGTSVLHCHVLDHEDQGMMRKIEISSSKTEYLQPVLVDPRPQFKLNALPGGQPQLVVIYSGPTCKACNEFLAQLDKESPIISAMGVKITAVSREKLAEPPSFPNIEITDAERSANMLKLLDPTGAQPTHAIYLVGKDGNVRFEYTGDHPIPNFDDVMIRLMEFRTSRN